MQPNLLNRLRIGNALCSSHIIRPLQEVTKLLDSCRFFSTEPSDEQRRGQLVSGIGSHPGQWASVDPAVLPYLRRCDMNNPDDDRKHRLDTNFHIMFLGTGSGTSITRLSSCMLVRLGAEGLLFDVGEGAHRNLKRSVGKIKKLSRIFITHTHGDHILGLPGLLLSANLANFFDEDSTLKIYGPQGIYNFITTTLALTHSKLKMRIEVYELIGGQVRIHWKRRAMVGSFPQFHYNSIIRKTITCGADGVWVIKPFETITGDTNFRKANDFEVKAAEIQHVPNVQTFGFVVEERTPQPKIDATLAQKLGLREGLKYQQLKNGFTVMSDDGTREIRPEEVLIENPAIGRKLAVLGDSCSVPPPMARLCRNADVLIHEATLAEADRELSDRRGHSSASMAGQFADNVNAKLLVLNHHGSPEYYDAQEPAREAEKVITGNTRVLSATDFMEVFIPREGFSFPKSIEVDRGQTWGTLLGELSALPSQGF